MTTTILTHDTLTTDHRVRHLVIEVLAALSLLLVCLSMVVNWLYVYVQFFGVAPAINPTTLGIHRSLMALGLVALSVMAAAGASRGGWRWTVVSGGVFFATVVQVRVEGAVPEF